MAQRSRYRRVSNRFWTSPTVRKLSEDARWLFLYLITCPHNNMLGAFLAPAGYIQADIKWPAKRVLAALKELQTVRKPDGQIGVIIYDEAAEVVLIKDHLFHEGISNPNCEKSARKCLASLPDTVEIFKALLDVLERLSPRLTKGLRQELTQRLGHTGTGTGTGTGTKTIRQAPPAPAGPTPGDEIDQLRQRYTNQPLIERCFKAIARTRKSGQVAPSILLAQLKWWESYPVGHVQECIKIYLDGGHPDQGRDEAYLRGIIRKQPIKAKGSEPDDFD